MVDKNLIWERAKEWFEAQPVKISERPVPENQVEFFLTGPALIQRIVQAIYYDQSVLLTGPRGCGKTYCIKAAIKVAAKEGLVPKEYVFLQGNKEFPRDYLAEDEVVFEPVQAAKRDEVVPSPRSAPIFRFARRRRDLTKSEVASGDFKIDKKIPAGSFKPVRFQSKDDEDLDGLVACLFESPGNSRFVLFLDELNRFSDGVLDSLLSVLEEREAVLAGEVFRLPVVVLMTMNPPGYDSSARPLSPPLAARISKSYRLSTPDIDAMSDYIVLDRWEKARRLHEGAGEAAVSTDESPVSVEFPDLDMSLVRRACLVTICLWGVVDPDGPEGEGNPEDGGWASRSRRGGGPSQLDPRQWVRKLTSWVERRPPRHGSLGASRANATELKSHEYLTEDSKDLIEKVSTKPEVLRAMKLIGKLARFGPDGRAAADWVVAGVGLAIQEARRSANENGRKAKLKTHHLEATAVEALSHKIYDNFNPVTHPDKTRAKEAAIGTIARAILGSDDAENWVSRRIDDDAAIRKSLDWWLGSDRDKPDHDLVSILRKACMTHRVSRERHLHLLERVREAGGKQPDLDTIEEALVHAGIIVVDDVTKDDGSSSRRWCFTEESWDQWFRHIARTWFTRVADKAVQEPDEDDSGFAVFWQKRLDELGPDQDRESMDPYKLSETLWEGWLGALSKLEWRAGFYDRVRSAGSVRESLHERLRSNKAVELLWRSYSQLPAEDRVLRIDDDPGLGEDEAASLFFIWIAEGSEPPQGTIELVAQQRSKGTDEADLLLLVAQATERLLMATDSERRQMIERLSSEGASEVLASVRGPSQQFVDLLGNALDAATPIVQIWGTEGHQLSLDLQTVAETIRA